MLDQERRVWSVPEVCSFSVGGPVTWPLPACALRLQAQVSSDLPASLLPHLYPSCRLSLLHTFSLSSSPPCPVIVWCHFPLLRLSGSQNCKLFFLCTSVDGYWGPSRQMPFLWATPLAGSLTAVKQHVQSPAQPDSQQPSLAPTLSVSYNTIFSQPAPTTVAGVRNKCLLSSVRLSADLL